MTPLRIFVGYDPVETVAFHVLAHSILTRASAPMSIIPLARKHLQSVYLRPRAADESTDFSLTRFLVPYLCGYDGVAVYMDCDMLVRGDIHRIGFPAGGDITNPPAVWVVQHDYTPRSSTKFLGQQQAAYPRKNWSSFMVFNNERCQRLTPEYVNTAPPSDLHRFAWTDDGDPVYTAEKGWHGDDTAIASLPLEWNHLVGEDNQCPIEDAKVLH